jgi:hypothetical protein
MPTTDRTQQLYVDYCKRSATSLGRALTLYETDLLMQTAARDAEREERSRDFTAAAVTALTQAARDERDFAGWLADVLAHVAAELGSVEALTAGRTGSWEAALVDRLVSGTVVDGDLTPYRRQS